MPVAPGAVSGEGCGTSCGDTMPVAPGAVSGDACGSSCSDAAPGAVSGKAAPAATCPFSGSAG